MQKLTHEIYCFDEFQLDLTRGSLFRGAVELKLRPKSFDVLKYLTENPGRLISKDELIEAVWNGTAVTDDSLVQCLKDIRRALGDQSQTIIKTVPRRGYIFEKEVSENGLGVYIEETSGVHLVIEESEEKNLQEANETYLSVSTKAESTLVSLVSIIKQHKRAAILTSLALIVGVIAATAWRINLNKNNGGNSPPMSVSVFQDFEVKSLSHVGNIVNNAISPEGKYVVYTTNDAGRESVWLRQIATDSTQQLVPPSEARYYGLTFSPDGEYIFYLRAENSNRNYGILYRIPSPLGGIPKKIAEDLEWCPTFSPDGRHMAFLRAPHSKNESQIMIADADGANERLLALRPLNEGYDFPVWSPDGQTIAASAGSVELGDSFREVVAVNVADGTERKLTTRKWYWTGTLAWLADGSGLIMSANPEKTVLPNQLWLLSYPSGEVLRITNDSNNYTYLSFTRDSRTLLAGHVKLLTHIWIAPEGDSARAHRVTSGLGEYRDVRWTPDEKLLVAAFGGSQMDIWLREANGDAPAKQLTANAGGNGGASMSPDGRYIAFDSDRAGDLHVWRMDADGGNPVQMTNGGGEKFAKISPDGRWIVYTSYPNWSLWKISIEGGEAVKISNDYAREHAFSPDGKWIAYTMLENDKYRWALMPFEGSLPVKKFEIPQHAGQMQMVRFSPDSRAILFISTTEGVSNIWQQPIDGSPPQQVTNFRSDRIFSYDWSDNGKQLAVIRGAWTADMVLLVQK